jgi:dephospho-CoA kinase
VHRLLREDAEVRAALSERFGEDVIGPGGDVDRAALAGRVFGDAEELGWLERLLHPRVRGAYLAWREQLAALPEPPPVCVVEVPLLYETGADERFDVVVVITAPGELRAARARVPLDERSSRLIPDDEKVQRADFAYMNDGTLEELDAFVADVLERVAPSA